MHAGWVRAPPTIVDGSAIPHWSLLVSVLVAFDGVVSDSIRLRSTFRGSGKSSDRREWEMVMATKVKAVLGSVAGCGGSSSATAESRKFSNEFRTVPSRNQPRVLTTLRERGKRLWMRPCGFS